MLRISREALDVQFPPLPGNRSDFFKTFHVGLRTFCHACWRRRNSSRLHRFELCCSLWWCAHASDLGGPCGSGQASRRWALWDAQERGCESLNSERRGLFGCFQNCKRHIGCIFCRIIFEFWITLHAVQVSACRPIPGQKDHWELISKFSL